MADTILFIDRLASLIASGTVRYEAAWLALYTTKGRPFDPPKTGKIAIKAINHCRDEILKVYDL